ncbi:hypothetical protein [Staphylococcus virus vB_SurM-PSU6]|nr:hypothetical protein [Staphylococcus virus vB_SurM-PSU6]
MKFHLDNNIVEGTPEELVKYQELIEGKDKDNQLFCFGHAHQLPEQEALNNFKGLLGSLKVADSYTDSTEISTDEAETASTELQVGDRVKVLKSEFGAEGEATVTAVLGHGEVEVAGTNKIGTYSTNWSNHVSNLEKIEDAPKGYTFWYIDGGVLNHRNVLKVTFGGFFEDSKGRRYTYQAVHDLLKPIDREDARKEFEGAKHSGSLLKYYPALDVFIRE